MKVMSGRCLCCGMNPQSAELLSSAGSSKMKGWSTADLNGPVWWLLGERELCLPQRRLSAGSDLTFLLRLFALGLRQQLGEMP